MLRKPILLMFCLLLLGPAWSASGALVGWWQFDETSGNIAKDSSGQGNDGTIIGTPQWVPGKIGGALQFNGSTYVNCGRKPSLNIRNQITMAFWFKVQAFSNTWEAFLAKSDGAYRASRSGGTGNSVHMGVTGSNYFDATPIVTDDQWHHYCGTYDGTTAIIYLDGKEVARATYGGQIGDSSSYDLYIGENSGATGRWLHGLLDDVQIYDNALTPTEILKIMPGLGSKSIAKDPIPKDTAVDVPRDATLSWTAGQYAAGHDVYLGTAFADVNTASRTDAKGVLAKQGQAETTYDPAGVFAYGQAYYWRVDEVNKPADNTIFKGNVWSFTAEPYGYPVKPVKVTASSAQPSMGPEKTIDGSGLDKSDLHRSEPTTMWMSAGAQPNWIQYEFDKPYKLYQLLVWNSNQLIETMLGFGAKKVTIETSADGTTWMALANVPEFARAPGMPGYAANTTVNFGGVEAKFVKLTINTNWGGLAPQTGLAEVRFSYVPVQARAPEPVAAATEVSIDTDLNWRPGREAGSHSVYFGTDPNALGAAKKVTDHSFDPGSLTFGTKYYWKVDEVNTVTYPGEVWSFTTQEFAAIDDFESYTDKAGAEVFTAWVDGVSDGLSNSVVGLNTAVNGTFCDGTIFHGGKVSMPFEYNNVKPPFYSQAERTFDKAQDWTTNGATHLSLWFRGLPAPFLVQPNGDILMSAQGADIYNTTDQFRYVYKMLTGDGSITARVDRLDLTNAWAKAGVMIRDSATPLVKAVHTIVSGSNGIEFAYRPTAGGNTPQWTTPGAVPAWVRLTRKGNTFTGECSTDGTTWTRIVNGTNTSVQDVPMNNTVCIGFAVTSHVANVTTVAQFSNIATTGNVTAQWQAADIGVAHGGNGPGDLYLTVKDSAGKAATVSNPGGANVNAWTQWRIPLSDLTAAGVKPTSIKKMAISVGDPAKPTAGGAGKINIDDIGYGRPVQ